MLMEYNTNSQAEEPARFLSMPKTPLVPVSQTLPKLVPLPRMPFPHLLPKSFKAPPSRPRPTGNHPPNSSLQGAPDGLLDCGVPPLITSSPSCGFLNLLTRWARPPRSDPGRLNGTQGGCPESRIAQPAPPPDSLQRRGPVFDPAASAP